MDDGKPRNSLFIKFIINCLCERLVFFLLLPFYLSVERTKNSAVITYTICGCHEISGPRDISITVKAYVKYKGTNMVMLLCVYVCFVKYKFLQEKILYIFLAIR